MTEVKTVKNLNQKTVKEQVLAFLKRNKTWAYRPSEIVIKINSNTNGVSDALKKLSAEGKIDYESVARNCAYYNYKE